MLAFFFFFFFQAEDGIRDLIVTGVQTCALPIWLAGVAVRRAPGAEAGAPLLRLTALVDRKSVVEGKRVDLGGCRIIKKKKKRVDTMRRSFGIDHDTTLIMLSVLVMR